MTINKALARAVSNLEMRVTIEQLAFGNRVEELYKFVGDKYIPYEWKIVSHQAGRGHKTRLSAEVENNNLYVALGAGYRKTDAFALTKQRRGRGSAIFSIRS